MLIRAVIVCLAAGPAVADCLTAADLDAGIRATADDGSYEDFRRVGPDLIEMTIDLGGGYIGRDMLVHGLYLAEFADYLDGVRDPESWTRVTFPVPNAELPVPSPDSSFDVTVNGRDSLGDFTESQSFRWGAMATMTFGDCAYDVIPGAVRSGAGGNWSTEVLHYLPSLGISLQISYMADGEPAAGERTYSNLKRLEVANR